MIKSSAKSIFLACLASLVPLSAFGISAPTVTSPGTATDTGSTVSSLTPTFNWNGVSGAAHYGLTISKSPYGGSNIVYQNNNISGSATSFTIPSGNLDYATHYRWNMVSIDASGVQSSNSNTLYFTSPNAPLNPPTINAPGTPTDTTSTISNLTPTCSWNGGNGAAHYGLTISKSPYGGSNIVYQNNNISGSATSFTIPTGNLDYATHYRWNMVSIDASGNQSSNSNTLYFTSPNAPLNPPTISAPGTATDTTSTISNLTPTCSWSGGNGAVHYGLTISKSPYGGSNIVYQNNNISGSATSFTIPTGNLDYATHYRWNMVSIDASGNQSSNSNTLYFTSPNAPLNPPTITAPGTETDTTSTISNLTPTCSWSGGNGAAHYGLTISKSPYGGSNIVYQNNNISGSATSFTIPSGNLDYATHYRWNMVSIDASGNQSSNSNTLFFTSPNSPLNPPTITAPGTETDTTSTISNLTPTCNWNGGNGAAQYGLTISKSPYGGSNIVYQNNNISGSATSFTIPTGNLDYATHYRWNMVSIDASGNQSGNSNTLFFTTPGGVTIPPTPTNPSPGTPTSPGTTTSTTLTMSWDASPGATSYGIGVRDMATNALVVDTFTASASYTASNLTAGRTYRWDVAAFNSAGHSSYTTALYFTVAGGDTIPAMPADTSPGSTTNPGPVMPGGSVTLNWSASSGATSYGIAVRDLVTSELVVDATTQSTSYTATNLSPGNTYRWNVAAFNATATSSYTSPLYFQTPSATGLTVSVTTPNGGETWNKRVPQTISWSVNGDTSAIANFFISYSVDGGATYPNNVGGTVPGTSRSTSWTPPMDVPTAAAGRIRVQARTVSNIVLAEDVSNANFNFGSVSTTGTRFDHDKFFALYNTSSFFDPLSVGEKAGLDKLLSFIETDPDMPLDSNSQHLRWAAYMLATTWWETGAAYKPVEEGWDTTKYHTIRGTVPYKATSQDDYFNHWYNGVNGNGNYASGDGFRYRGRGYVQLTGRGLYAALKEASGKDLIGNPDLAGDSIGDWSIPYDIMSDGMRLGLFRPTSKFLNGLESYISATGSPDYLHARRIIQYIDGNDSVEQYAIAQKIADAAGKFEAMLKASPGNSSSVATPAISPEGGTYIGATGQQQASIFAGAGVYDPTASNATTATQGESVTVSLSCVTDDATIYYTTDGSTPTTASAIYSTPFTVSDPTTVKAMAVASGYADSGVSTGSFAFVPAADTGAVSVTISPAGAVNAGAEWQIDGGTWQNSGDTVSGLSVGNHTIAFKPLVGWSTPNDLLVTVSAGETISTYTGYAPAVQFGNISTRLRVETGDNVLIGGFIVAGTQPKKVIIRGIGSSLPFADKLANPTLELYGPSGLIEANDNWVDSPNKQAIIDSTVPPSSDLESAIVAILPANNAGYTAVVRGVNNTTGIGVVEAYDLDPSVDSTLANISTRGFVATGDNVLIAGTIVIGTDARTVIVRAIGPSLPFAGKLENPTLELRDSNGALLEANDNWVDSPNKQAIIDSAIPPANDLESAIVATLPANNASYTAIVRGVNNTTGIAVVEVYALQ
jgi:Fn3 associated